MAQAQTGKTVQQSANVPAPSQAPNAPQPVLRDYASI